MIRWMMVLPALLMGCEATDATRTDTADLDLSRAALDCPEGERYTLASRLCDGRTRGLGDDRWDLRRSLGGGCQLNEPGTGWYLRFEEGAGGLAEIRGTTDDPHSLGEVLDTLTWHVEPATEVLPELLILRGVDRYQLHQCQEDQTPIAILVREE